MKRRAVLLVSGVALGAGLFSFMAVRSRPTPAPVASQPVEVLRADLDLREGKLYRHGQPEPFAGRLVENHGTNGPRKLQIEIRDGKADGVAKGWFESGQLQVEEFFSAGVSEGARTRFHPNGQKKSIEQIHHGVLGGPYLEWHDNGAKALEMTMLDGKPEGVAQAWNPDGTPKSRTRFEAGRIVLREFFPESLAAAEAPKP